MQYKVELISYETGAVVKTLGPIDGERKAEKVAAGLEHQSSDDFYTVVVECEVL